MTRGRGLPARWGAFGWLDAGPAGLCTPGSGGLVALLEFLPPAPPPEGLLARIENRLDAFERAQADAGLLLHPTDRPREMGIAVLEGDRVVDLFEKPQQPRSNLAAVGLWMLGPAAVERLRRDPSTRADGEIDLTGTIAAMLVDGADVRGWELDGEWLDSGAVPSLLSTQARLLADLRPALPDAQETRIEGAVAAGEDVHVTHSTLRGPLLIGAGVEIDDCELGPNVVIGDGASLRSVRLSDAMVVAGATLEGVTHAGVVVNAANEVGR